MPDSQFPSPHGLPLLPRLEDETLFSWVSRHHRRWGAKRASWTANVFFRSTPSWIAPRSTKWTRWVCSSHERRIRRCSELPPLARCLDSSGRFW